MASPLLVAEDLSGFPGAPFDASLVTAVAAGVRSEAGWHIAPVVTETLTVDGDGGRHLFLPTLLLSDVAEVRDVSTDTPTVLDGWRMSRAGILFRAAGWPCGFQTIEVDVTHGYDECPPDLLPVVADLCQAAAMDKTVAQEAAQPFSVTRTSLSTLASWRAGGGALDRYKIPPRP